MSKHRVLFEFTATPGVNATSGSDAGWTEAFYDPADSTDEECDTKARLMMAVRRVCLTPGWRIVAIRISQLDATNNLVRKGRLVQFGGTIGQGQYPGPAATVDEQPWDAINLSLNTVGGSRRAFLMRGIGNDVVGASGQYLAPPGFIARSAILATALKGGGPGVGGFGGLNAIPSTPYALRTRSTPRQTLIIGVFINVVAGVNLVADATHPMILVPSATVQAGNTISITGVQEMRGMNAQWRVTQTQVSPTNINQTYCLLLPRRRVTIIDTYKLGGVVTYWNWALDNITGLTIGNGASRRTGRPPQQRRGRRSAHRS